VRKAIFLAKKMGESLGRSPILQRTMSKFKKNTRNLKYIMRLPLLIIAFFALHCKPESSQPDPVTPVNPMGTFYVGADISYTNEMEDCGVVYKENGVAKDPYQMFADHGCNMVRLRLWHTPSWYDTLNTGKRYSDFQDVRRSMMRAKAAGMPVLLDIHLSDIWADPQRQIVPKAWLPVVNNLPVLADSVFNYVQSTLLRLQADGLSPVMVQIGNETNRGILLSPADDAANAPINWPRNATLFKAGISAVRAVEASSGKKIKIALHIAGPSATPDLMEKFWANGVRDFDVIGMSYYWAWHKPTTIAETGSTIAYLRQRYAGKEVIIFETGYIWTTASNDQSSNIINETHPDYAPSSPENQLKWLVDLSKEVKKQGGIGVLYWEPTWVSSPCYNPWGQGSAQEHATFFDFNNNLLPNGGIGWFKAKF
jgi:arabinogalactan endo-1,4-beta-galactosidase